MRTPPSPSPVRTAPMRQALAARYQQFLDAFNTGDHERIGQLIAPTFMDHHPGIEISGIASFQEMVRNVRRALRLEAEAEDILQAEDRVIVRVRYRGTHVGTILGYPATGGPIEWTSTEIWLVSNGRFVERWAQDDMLSLRRQLAGDAGNVALARRISEAVNDRDYDAMDEFFAQSFRDHNPAWRVETLAELKDLIRAAVDALAFTAHLDHLYPAAGGRVVMQITFTGRHVGAIFGREPTGRPLEWTSTEVYRFLHGQVSERWVQADTAGLMRQLGVPLPQ